MKAPASATAFSAMSSAAACCCIWSMRPANMPARPTRRCGPSSTPMTGDLADKIEIVALNKIDAVDAGRTEEAEGPAEARREEDAAADLGRHRRRRQGRAAGAGRGDRRSAGVASRPRAPPGRAVVADAAGLTSAPDLRSTPTSAVSRWREHTPRNQGTGAYRFRDTRCHSTAPMTPAAEKFPPHRRQGRLLAADRFRRRRGAGGVARRAGRRHRQAARRGPRRADRLVGLDRARPQPPETAARPAEARGKPGRRRGRADRAGADLVGGAGRITASAPGRSW